MLELNIRLQPRGGRSEITGIENGMLKIRVNRPPVDGAANKALIELLSACLGVPRRQVEILRGVHHRNKLLRISGLDDAGTALQKLEPTSK
ncbi:MAG: DUF167 domain-containing protein [Gammaproteobacteria bacterium]|nr:DUF167 domain-containing protein [Gammaproteobacteria bacterium]